MANPTYKRLFALAIVAGLSATVGILGCQNGTNMRSPSPDSTTRPVMANIFGTAQPKGGAQLWADNCTRCHNAPSPDRFSDAQWEVVVQHMRLRANLTGEESRKIAEFLKASN